MIFLGCWGTSGTPNECDKAECLADRKPPKAKNNTKFCCCAEDFCNANFMDAYVPADDIPFVTTEITPKKNVNSLCWIITAVLLFIVLMMVALGASFYIWKKKPKKHDVEVGHQHTLPPPADYSLDKLKLLNMIGKLFINFLLLLL